MFQRERNGSGERLVAGVLAGGSSRRLGFHKGFVDWRGKTLLEHSLGNVSRWADEVYILTKSRSEMGNFGYPVIPDLMSTPTPLSGILSIAPFVSDYLLLTACDIVVLAPDLFGYLWELRCEEKAVVVGSGDLLQPFIGLYPVKLMPLWEQAYRAGDYRLQKIVKAMPKKVLRQSDLEEKYGQSPLFVNVNAQSDIELLRRLPLRCN